MGSPMAEAFLKSRLNPDCTRHIKGNASDTVKEVPVKWLAVFRNRGNSFAVDVANRLVISEVWVLPSPDNPLKTEAKVSVEVDVTPEMCNSRSEVHDGCLLFLLDEVTAITVATLNAAEGRGLGSPGVSNTINVMFHNPAKVGTRLRAVGTSLSGGPDANTARIEIFDSNHRLIASGAQLMMQPSKPTKPAKSKAKM